MKIWLFNCFFIAYLNMSGCKYKFLIIISVLSMFNLTNCIPIMKKNNTINKRDDKIVEIKLPAHKTSHDDLILWIKKAVESMASRVDITLETNNNNNKINKFDKNNIFNDINNKYLTNFNELYPPLINTNSYLPFYFGEPGIKYDNIKPINYIKNENNNEQLNDETKIINESTKIKTNSKYQNSIPFEAFITISREQNVDQEQEQALSTKIQNLQKPNDENINQKIKIINNSNKQDDIINNNNDNSNKRQLSTIGDLLNQLGIFGKPNGNKTPEASTITSIFSRPTKKKIRGTTARPFSIEFDDLPDIPDKNETSQKQEFDDEEEEQQGSLGSIADLIPLALPILEDLSNPESESDLIEVLEAAIPIIQGLSDADGENGGTQELINMIVPVIKKIVGGKNGQGIDLTAIAAPLFNLLAPFIGPLLAPVIGPLIRTISNPTPEGSSLQSLITAVLGPLTTPQEPSKMSPLSIVLAGTTAALLKELKLGQPGGSDLGAFISAILTGVISGTSAGLSGGSSGDKSHGEHDNYQAYNPYTTNIPSPVASSIVNFGYGNRPSPGPPVHSPFYIHRPSYSPSTVNIGSTIKPETTRPTVYNNYNYHQSTTLLPIKKPSPKPIINNPGSFPDASTDIHHEQIPNAVPAHTVNPLALIGDTIKDVLGAGGQIVAAFINAVVGIFGGSSQS